MEISSKATEQFHPVKHASQCIDVDFEESTLVSTVIPDLLCLSLIPH